MSALHTLDSNCCPRSVTIVEGTPKQAIQPWIRDCATASALIVEMVKASGHRVNLSMHVKRYVYPRDGGSGPTRSIWIVWNLVSGTGKEKSGITV